MVELKKTALNVLEWILWYAECEDYSVFFESRLKACLQAEGIAK